MQRFTRNIIVASTAVFLLTGCARTKVTSGMAISSYKISITALTGANGTSANGVTTAYMFEDNATEVFIQLNIENAKDSYHYEARAEDSKTGDKILLGTLKNSVENLRYSLHFESEKSLQNHTNIIITLQSNSGDSNSGLIVATGILKWMNP